MISVFGATGFIGSRFCEMYPDDTVSMPRDCMGGYTGQVLYLISTTHNYNRLCMDVETNLLWLSKNLDNLTPKHTFNFISSWFIYGSGSYYTNEYQDGTPPKGNYSYTKWLAEKLIRWYCEREEIPYRIFRLANVFGKGDKFSKQKNALQYLINEMRHNRDIKLYNGGMFYRDYIHVDDACSAMHKGMIVLPVNGVYNIGSGRRILFRELILLAHAVLGSKSKIEIMEPSEFHKKVSTSSTILDISKIEKHGIEMNSSPYEKLVRMILDDK